MGVAATITKFAGDLQLAPAGTPVLIAPAVLIQDANGNAVPGVPVSFTVDPGSGNVTGPTPQNTDANGIATTGWTLGTTAGLNTLTATAGALNAIFTATGTGAAATITKIAGDLQLAPAGTAVPAAPQVLIKDANGNAVRGVSVGFTVTGGGSFTGYLHLTNASGIATTSWTLGTTAGPNTLTATAGTLSATFNATGTATTGAATQIAANGGTYNIATHGTAVATPPSVIVTDANGNPVSGVSVMFAVASGGGTIAGGTTQTDVHGIATVGSWTLGSVTASINNNSLTATSQGLTGSPVTFYATGTATTGAATQIAANGGTYNIATHGTAVATPPSVIVTDANGNPVSGVSVMFAVASGGGTIAGGTTQTDVHGIATVGSWTLGSVTASINNNSLTATSQGLTGSPVTFYATGLP